MEETRREGQNFSEVVAPREEKVYWRMLGFLYRTEWRLVEASYLVRGL